MKIAHEKLSTVLEFSKGMCLGIVIENQRFMYEFVTDIKKSIEKSETGIIISQNNEPISVADKVSLIIDFIDFPLNSKALSTKIVNELSRIAENETFYNETHKLLAQIEKTVYKYAMDVPHEIGFEKLNMQNILKSIGVFVEDDYDNLEEKILAYMDLTRELEGKELFVFVNLRSFISNSNFDTMLETALEREHNILLIDGMEYQKLEKEKRLIIDSDLCEI